MDGEVKHHRVRTNGIWMHVAEQGSTGPLVLLIHGFPELWFSWRHQMAHLSRRGYHVIAPDLRGYGETDAPTDPLSYSCFHLVGDIIGLIDHLEAQQVNPHLSSRQCLCLCGNLRAQPKCSMKCLNSMGLACLVQLSWTPSEPF